jgi:hypothetical protein
MTLAQDGAAVSGDITMTGLFDGNTSGPVQGSVTGDIVKMVARLSAFSARSECMVIGDRMDCITEGRVASRWTFVRKK